MLPLPLANMPFKVHKSYRLPRPLLLKVLQALRPPHRTVPRRLAVVTVATLCDGCFNEGRGARATPLVHTAALAEFFMRGVSLGCRPAKESVAFTRFYCS